MKHVLLFLSLLLSVSLSAQDIKTFVSQQMTEYPKSHLLDLYKTCFGHPSSPGAANGTILSVLLTRWV